MMTRVRLLPLVFVLLLLLPGPSAAQDPSDAFFDTTTVGEIRMAVNPRDWQNLKDHFQENTYYPADLRWNGQVVRSVGIRSRGTGSRRANKPGLRVDMNRYTANQTFLGLKSFILRNNSQDATNLRERMAMTFFKNLGIATAERESHVKLFVNDEYIGLYTLVESPDKDFLQKRFGENGGHLYEFHFDNEAVLAGQAPFTYQFLGANPALYVPTPFKPETLEDDPQGDVIARFVQAVSDTNFAGWRTAVSAFIDLPKFVRYLALENFLAEEDGHTGDYGPNNFYIYRFLNTEKFEYIPWDKSNAFWDVTFSIFRNIKDGPDDHRNKLVVRAFQEPDLLNLYLDTMLEAANFASQGATATTPGWLEAEIDADYQQIRAAALADVSIFSNAEFEQAIVDLKAFGRDRAGLIRTQVAAARGQ